MALAFRVTMVVQAEFNVPKPNAAQTAHINTVKSDGEYAIKNNPIAWAIIPVTHIIMSPFLSWILPAIGLEITRTIE